MRLEPIEKPKGLLMRIAFWMTRRQFGKVMTPMKVLYPRMPGMLKLSYEIVKFETKGIRLEPGLHFMVVMLASQINGCGFCMDLARAMAIREHLGMEKLDALSEYRVSPLFSDRERAALTYGEEATRHKRVSDAVFGALRARSAPQRGRRRRGTTRQVAARGCTARSPARGAPLPRASGLGARGRGRAAGARAGVARVQGRPGIACLGPAWRRTRAQSVLSRSS